MNALKLPFAFDPDKMLSEISGFNQEDYSDIYNPSVTLKTLWNIHLIEPVGGPHTKVEFVPSAALKQRPYLLSVFETFKCRVETFRIHTLDPGANIKPHRDMGYSYEHGFTRIHIPVTTNNQVHLLVNGERINMNPGECWYCNFNEIHEVQNNSALPRTHLILDCVINDWFTAQFNKAMSN